MRYQILGLAIAALLAGCNAPTPPPTASPQPEPTVPVTAPAALPEPLPEEEAKPEPASEEPKAKTGNPAVVAALRAEIKEKKALAQKAFDGGVAIDGHTSAGTAFNEIHIPEHTCVVLGRLLGKAKLVRPLEVEYKLDFDTQTTENASDLRIMSVSLDNFAGVAEQIMSLSHDERVVTWNLDCAGKLGLPKDYIKQDGKSSFYTVTNKGTTLKVLGDIEDGYAQKIMDAIEANPSVEVVALGSGGGYVHEAMKAGQYIRRKGLDTTLYNNCYSACPLVFMAGVERQNWSPYPQLGFHQIYTSDGEAVPLDSPAYRAVYSYLTGMGIEPRYVLQKMWSAPPTRHDQC